MKWKTEGLQRLGFRKVYETIHGSAWIRAKVRSDWAIGDCVLVMSQFVTRFQVAFDMTLIRLEALGAIAEDPKVHAAAEVIRASPKVAGLRDVMRKFGKGFKKKVNKAATAIAKGKIINKLRQTYVKVLEGPIGDLGVKAGARALSAFGVPAKATELAINQRRAAQADRLKHGGWAGMVSRATEQGGDGLKGAMREAAMRNLEAGKTSLKKAIPFGMGNLAKSLDAKVAYAQVSGDWSDVYD